MTAAAIAFPRENFPAGSGWGGLGFRPDLPERVASSLYDSDLSTRQTVELMARHIANAQDDPLFRTVARQVRATWATGSQLLPTVWAVFWFCKHRVRFVTDEEAVFGLFGETDQVDFLIEPRVLLRMRCPAGDCDEFTMLSLALLVANGIPCEIVTAACDRERPGQWSHVYGQVVLPDGRRMALDCSPAGKWPGWEVPDCDIQRKQIWDLNGNQSDAPEASKDLRMHAYKRRGLGQDEAPASLDTSGNVVGDVTAGQWMNGSWVPNSQYDPSGGLWTQLSQAQGGGSGFNLNSFFANLFSAGSKIGTVAVAPPGSVIQQPGFTFSNMGIPSSIGGIGTGTILLLAVLGIGAVALMSAGRK